MNKINTKQGPISCKSIHEPKWKKKLATDGFSVRDRLSPILGPIITEFQNDWRERIYTPDVVVFSLVTGVLACDTTLSAAVVRNNADRILQGLDVASLNTGPYCDARTRLAPPLPDSMRKLKSLAAVVFPSEGRKQAYGFLRGTTE